MNRREAAAAPADLTIQAGLKLLTVPRAPKELPVTALIRNAHGIVDWKLFVKE